MGRKPSTERARREHVPTPPGNVQRKVALERRGGREVDEIKRK